MEDRKYYGCFVPDGEGYSVFFPDLPGCLTCGDTMDRALAMAGDALITYLDDSDPPPSGYEEAWEKARAEHDGVNERLLPEGTEMILISPKIADIVW